MRGGARLVCFIMAVAACSLPIAAVGDGGDGHEKRLLVPMTFRPPKIDGRLDDPCWRRAAKASNFLQLYPTPRAPATVVTEVFVLKDGKCLYFGFRCYDPEPDKIVAFQTKRDGRMGRDDRVEIFLDTFNDRRRLFNFQLNVLGTKTDVKWGNWDWNEVWEAAVSRTKDGWEAEIAIPYRILSYDPKAKVWGVNFLRYIHHLDELDVWVYRIEPIFRPENMGDLVNPLPEGLRPVRPRPRLLHYVMSDLRFEGKGAKVGRTGLDLAHSLSPTMRAALTLFPDYSQIEAVYETIDFSYTERRLPEKRPFFIEGQEALGSPLFYSRRIEEFDLGAKVFGKHGPYMIGLLDTHSFKTGRNDLLVNIVRDLGRRNSASFSLVNKLDGSHRNTAFHLGLGYWLTDRLNLGAGYSRSFTKGRGGDGYSLGVHLGHYWRRAGFYISYSAVSPDYRVEDGFVPITDSKSLSMGLFGRYRPPHGKWYRSIGGGLFWSRSWRFSGELWNWSRGVRGRLLLTNEFVFGCSYTDSFWKPFRDRTFSLSVGYGTRTPNFIRFSLTRGKRAGANYNFKSVTLGYKSPDKRLTLRVEYELRRMAYPGTPPAKDFQFILSASYDISQFTWLALRVYSRKRQGTNISLVLTQKNEDGSGFYLILGDPFQPKTAKRVAFKIIRALLSP